MMKFLCGLILFFFAGIIPVSGQVTDSAKYKSLDPYYFNLQYLKEDSALILDVRMPFEFRGKRIKDAINVPSSRELNSLTDTISRGYALLLYCSTDYRSRDAAEKLYEKGFRKLYNLEGGIVAWKKDNMPVVKGRVKRQRAE
jgi:rhodanese-related sulfurtransferase